MAGNRLIISFDGGGIVGYFSCLMLDAIWGDKLPDNAVLAGTSTGGIIALALAHGLAPIQIASMYRKNARKIFAKKWFTGWGAKYSSDGLRDVLTDVFGGTCIYGLSRPVVITTTEYGVKALGTYDRPTVIHNMQFVEGKSLRRIDRSDGSPQFVDARERQIILTNWSCVDVALATSAAPTYFKPHEIEGRYFADGALYANNPAAKALDLVGTEGTKLLSIGTGLVRRQTDPSWSMGLIKTLKTVLAMTINGSQESVDDGCALRMGANFFRLNPVTPDWALDDIDNFEEMDALVRSDAIQKQIAQAREFLVR